MEDIGSSPLESREAELWIYRQAKTGKQPSYIADELLKFWEREQLTINGKATVSRYCISNGFFPSLIRVLRKDLADEKPLPWECVLEVLFKNPGEITAELTEALLNGANRDARTRETAATALFFKSKEPVWDRLHRARLDDARTRAEKERVKIFSELRIFKTEGMQEELKASLTRLLTLFPDDVEAGRMVRDLSEGEIEKTLRRLRHIRETRDQAQRSIHEERTEWPELQKRLQVIKPTLDLQGAYHLAIGLQAMGLFEDALDVLRSQGKNWTLNEKLFEIELLLNSRLFAEALQTSQSLLRQFAHDPDCVQAALYYSAKSYYGLEDIEQAVGILRGLLNHRPEYRDAALLLTEWEGELR
jgi:hypothetical protein